MVSYRKGPDPRGLAGFGAGPLGGLPPSFRLRWVSVRLRIEDNVRAFPCLGESQKGV